jgi:DNA-binding SARP family transcriptional activator
MEFRILGAVEIVGDGHLVRAPGGRTASLLFALLLQPRVAVDQQELLRTLWPDRRPPSAAANLRQYVTRGRRLLDGCANGGGARLRSTPAGYLLQVDRDELDLTRFADLSERGRKAVARGNLPQGRVHLESAMGMWRGQLGHGVLLGPDIRRKAVYWEELRLDTHRSLLEARLVLGEHNEAVAELGSLVAAHPFREEFVGMLMVALYRAHRKRDALRVYGQTRRRFIEDLNLEPSRNLRDLEESIVAEDIPLGRGFGWLELPSGSGVRATARALPS